jgi:hypothetical protein
VADGGNLIKNSTLSITFDLTDPEAPPLHRLRQRRCSGYGCSYRCQHCRHPHVGPRQSRPRLGR